MATVDGEGQIAELEATMRTLAAQKRERREAYPDKINTELIEVHRNIDVLRQDLTKAEVFKHSSVLKSPVAGRVQQLEVNTLGEMVQTGQLLMVIVPDGTKLEIDAMLLNRDKAFVREGQEAWVKLEAFPFTRFALSKARCSRFPMTPFPPAVHSRRRRRRKKPLATPQDRWCSLCPLRSMGRRSGSNVGMLCLRPACR
ncbi:HlyD family efflux transporter periplasmic adaptor subunit [Mesorhizobium sp. B2-5-9]|uniref:HlyD family efflux transporter periplasmic adaptor subunit n=1 Tax=Mesorhizobium sp. B2-5-9 TaxID=2589921 RepID=UPI00112B2605|nr:HlyD family efflux transporter periplasmic adaptor subunit [Mesorhizobium sp. B2-5-9]TPJ98528.1 HlyD family efflux transporter periplasmic adaptor subunit [Mesorhizobium sp. B2-5-9]